MSNAIYFDGHSAQLHPVEVHAEGGLLHIAGTAISQSWTLAKVTLAEPFEHAPAVLYLPDGGRCEVDGPAARSELAGALGYRPSLVMRWQRHWYAALAALVALLCFGVVMWLYGLPAAAERIADALPPSVDSKIGASTLRGLEGKLFKPSRLSDERIAQLQQVLAEVTPANPRQPIHLLVREALMLGPNALALPDGTIVITDAMVRGIDENPAMSEAQRHAALAGVLAHEVGHIQRRHSIRVLARSSLTAAASATLFGDFSAVAAGVPAVLANAHYSRAMETEADTYAIDTLHAKGLPTEPLAQLFEWLERVNDASPQKNTPAWMKQVLPYASSHPVTSERIARFRGLSEQ
jgi:Zn-dependent protease with chaperone function